VVSARIRLRRPSVAELTALIGFLLFVIVMAGVVVSRETWNEISSCTRPTGKCAQAQAAQTAKIVDQITDRQLVGTWCVINNPGADLTAIRDCTVANARRLP